MKHGKDRSAEQFGLDAFQRKEPEATRSLSVEGRHKGISTPDACQYQTHHALGLLLFVIQIHKDEMEMPPGLRKTQHPKGQPAVGPS